MTEKRGPFRDRRCLNPECRREFTTREQIMAERQDLRLCAKTRLSHIQPQSSGARAAARRPPGGAESAGRNQPCVPNAGSFA